MQNKIIIGITQRVDKVESYKECRDALDQRLINWVVTSGFIPVPIPNSLIDINSSVNFQPVIDKWLQILNIKAILLSGGNDIGDILQRDLTENYLLSWAEQNVVPVLGICRGMQMMGVWDGGKLIEVEGHVSVHHKLQIVDEELQVYPELVNSYHNQVLEKCPNSFKILAKSEDGNIEAMRHKSLPWEAWMWHPERECEFLKSDQDRFKKLMKCEK